MENILISRHFKLSALLFVFISCVMMVVCVQANIITTGQVTNQDNTIQWNWNTYIPNNTSQILVGYNNFGTMTMSGNSTILRFASLHVAGGENSTGTFTMLNGANVIFPIYENHYIYIANGINSHGTMTLKSANTIVDLSDNLYIGTKSGSFGELLVKDGAVFKAGYLHYIGYAAGGYGKVTVDGVGSQLTAGDTTNIGWGGTGEIVIKNGGYVYTKNHIVLGNSNGSKGTIEVTGAGSLWEANGTFHIGRGGSPTDPIPAIGTLKMARGGKIQSGSLYIGYSSYGAEGTLDATIGNNGASAVDCGLIETTNIRLINAYLEIHVDPGVNLTIGTQYTLVDYNILGNGTSYTQFVGINEGDIYTSDRGYHFRINYSTDLGGGDLGITATVVEIPPCVVDEVDLFLLTSHWLESGCGNPDWCSGADIDGSTIVDFSDFAQIALYWLGSCPDDWPWQ